MCVCVRVCVCGACVCVYVCVCFVVYGGGGDCSVCISAVLWNSTNAFHLLHNASVSSVGSGIKVGTGS